MDNHKTMHQVQVFLCGAANWPIFSRSPPAQSKENIWPRQGYRENSKSQRINQTVCKDIEYNI